jgi:hypothetical protein
MQFEAARKYPQTNHLTLFIRNGRAKLRREKSMWPKCIVDSGSSFFAYKLRFSIPVVDHAEKCIIA